MATWAPVARPQTILVPAPMYHTNGFNTFLSAGRRPAGNTRKVRRRTGFRRDRDDTASPTSPRPRRCWHASPRARHPADRDLSSVVWILQGAAVMPPSLLRTWFELLSPEQVVMAYGMTENLGPDRAARRRMADAPRQRRSRLPRHRDPDPGRRRQDRCAPGELGEVYLRAPMSRYRYLGGGAAASVDTGRFPHRRRHRPSRRRRLPVHRRPARRHDRHRRRQRVPGRSGIRAGRATRTSPTSW